MGGGNCDIEVANLGGKFIKLYTDGFCVINLPLHCLNCGLGNSVMLRKSFVVTKHNIKSYTGWGET